MVQVYFDNIEKQIALCIGSANKRIYVAMAWFTNQALFDSLLIARRQQVEVKILILDDILNRGEFGLNFGVLESNGAEVCFANSKGGLMHNKFCIIDDRVITGSYNWTYHANKNNENIIISDDERLVANYCEHFNMLFCVGKRIQLPYQQIKWTDIKEGDFSELKRNIYRDIVANKDKNYKQKKLKLIKLDDAFKSGNKQDLINASNMKTCLYKTITDVLTSQYKNFELQIWEENKTGKPYEDIEYTQIRKWYYMPYELKQDKNHQEYLEGYLQRIKDYEVPYGTKLNIYDKEFIEIIKEFSAKESLPNIKSERIPDELLCIEYAKYFFYDFQSPMFNKRQPGKWKSGAQREIMAINLFGIVESVDGDNVVFYEGWNPEKRGEIIKNELFTARI